jgi:hypothetical protein
MSGYSVKIIAARSDEITVRTSMKLLTSGPT